MTPSGQSAVAGATLDALTAAAAPFRRTGRIEEIVAGILHLASEDSRYVTGLN